MSKQLTRSRKRLKKRLKRSKKRSKLPRRRTRPQRLRERERLQLLRPSPQLEQHEEWSLNQMGACLGRRCCPHTDRISKRNKSHECEFEIVLRVRAGWANDNKPHDSSDHELVCKSIDCSRLTKCKYIINQSIIVFEPLAYQIRNPGAALFSLT